MRHEWERQHRSTHMTRCRMRVTITEVTAKTCQSILESIQELDDISNKLTLMYNYYFGIISTHIGITTTTSQFISTHTKIGTPHEKAPVTMQTEVNLLIWLFRT